LLCFFANFLVWVFIMWKDLVLLLLHWLFLFGFLDGQIRFDLYWAVVTSVGWICSFEYIHNLDYKIHNNLVHLCRYKDTKPLVHSIPTHI
jgi:hypothetical protein